MISLINLDNSLDDKNRPIGHELKMLKELPIILNNQTEILAGKYYVQELSGKRQTLPFSLRIDSKKVYIKMLCNYFLSLIRAKGDLLVYIDTSEAMLWGLAFFKGKRRIVSITYTRWDIYIKKVYVKNLFEDFWLKEL